MVTELNDPKIFSYHKGVVPISPFFYEKFIWILKKDIYFCTFWENAEKFWEKTG